MMDTSRIIRLLQPLCMVEMVKGDLEVKPVDGGYFGVPYLVGWRDSEPSITYTDWVATGDMIKTNWGAHDSGGGAGDGAAYAFWGLVGTNFGRQGKDFMEQYQDSPVVQYKAILISSVGYPAHASTWNGGIPYTVGEFNETIHQISERLIIENVPSYLYLAKVDGMPYHFATEANAQKWIDKTLEREEKTKPKEGAARAKKIASLGAYKAKIQKKLQAAKLRDYQNDDLKKKVLDMLEREHVEASNRLSRI